MDDFARVEGRGRVTVDAVEALLDGALRSDGGFDGDFARAGDGADLARLARTAGAAGTVSAIGFGKQMAQRPSSSPWMHSLLKARKPLVFVSPTFFEYPCSKTTPQRYGDFAPNGYRDRPESSLVTADRGGFSLKSCLRTRSEDWTQSEAGRTLFPRDLNHEIGGIAARIDCCLAMDENVEICATLEPQDTFREPLADPLAAGVSDRLEHVQVRHVEDPHEHGDLLPRPTCVTCFNAMDSIASGWWCDNCQQFD